MGVTKLELLDLDWKLLRIEVFEQEEDYCEEDYHEETDVTGKRLSDALFWQRKKGNYPYLRSRR